MRNSIYVYACAAILFTACGNSTKKENLQKDVNQDKNQKMDSEITGSYEAKSISATLDHYLSLKKALVEDNSEEAANTGKLLFDALVEFDQSSVSDQQQELAEIIEDAKMHAEHINENNGNIVHQREHFDVLSADIKDMVAIVGTDRTLYQQYCPMYNDNKGGMWLSASNEIKNPFFGSKMLKCGKVQETITIE